MSSTRCTWSAIAPVLREPFQQRPDRQRGPVPAPDEHHRRRRRRARRSSSRRPTWNTSCTVPAAPGRKTSPSGRSAAAPPRGSRCGSTSRRGRRTRSAARGRRTRSGTPSESRPDSDPGAHRHPGARPGGDVGSERRHRCQVDDRGVEVAVRVVGRARRRGSRPPSHPGRRPWRRWRRVRAAGRAGPPSGSRPCPAPRRGRPSRPPPADRATYSSRASSTAWSCSAMARVRSIAAAAVRPGVDPGVRRRRVGAVQAGVQLVGGVRARHGRGRTARRVRRGTPAAPRRRTSSSTPSANRQPRNTAPVTSSPASACGALAEVDRLDVPAPGLRGARVDPAVDLREGLDLEDAHALAHQARDDGGRDVPRDLDRHPVRGVLERDLLGLATVRAVAVEHRPDLLVHRL